LVDNNSILGAYPQVTNDKIEEILARPEYGGIEFYHTGDVPINGVLIAVLLCLLFRSVKTGLLSMIPNLSPASSRPKLRPISSGPLGGAAGRPDSYGGLSARYGFGG
jgi:hypothetical protein